MSSDQFQLRADYQPSGDQPEAIARLTEGLDGDAAETLMALGLDMGRVIVRDTGGLDDATAEDVLQPRVRAVRRLMMAAGQATASTEAPAEPNELGIAQGLSAKQNDQMLEPRTTDLRDRIVAQRAHVAAADLRAERGVEGSSLDSRVQCCPRIRYPAARGRKIAVCSTSAMTWLAVTIATYRRTSSCPLRCHFSSGIARTS